jgi:hypothetical protein
MTLKDYAKKQGIDVSTLGPFCRRDPLKRKKLGVTSRSFDSCSTTTPPIVDEHRQYLVYQFNDDNSAFCHGEDKSRNMNCGQRAGHPLRINQPKKVKGANQLPTDAMAFISGTINVSISDSDLVQITRRLNEMPHGTNYLINKIKTDRLLRENGITVIDVPDNCLSADYDRVIVFRSGTPQASSVEMTPTMKSLLLRFLIDPSRKNLMSRDEARDVGGNVHRYNAGYSQAQKSSKMYADTRGCAIKDRRNGKPLRLPSVASGTMDLLTSMPDALRTTFCDVMIAMQHLARKHHHQAFHDDWRNKLVHENLWKDIFGENSEIIVWEYVGFIARLTTKTDRLAMHLDLKNDGREGYDICCTYSYVLDGYRVTIVLASRQDWGSIMERIREVEIEDGVFLLPNQIISHSF